MSIVTVFRQVPAPITGMIGTIHERAFEAFEADLDWLATTGVLVERFDPNTAPAEVEKRPLVQQLLRDASNLPVILVNDAIVSKGAYVSRTQLARLAGRAQGSVPAEVVRELARLGAVAAVGPDEAVRAECTRARDLGLGEAAVTEAIATGVALRHREPAA